MVFDSLIRVIYILYSFWGCCLLVFSFPWELKREERLRSVEKQNLLALFFLNGHFEITNPPSCLYTRNVHTWNGWANIQPVVSVLSLYKKEKEEPIVFVEKKGTWLTWNCPRARRKRKSSSFFFLFWPLLPDRYSKYATGIYTSDKTSSSSSCLSSIALLLLSLRVIFDLSYGTHTPAGQVSLFHII